MKLTWEKIQHTKLRHVRTNTPALITQLSPSAKKQKPPAMSNNHQEN